MKRSGIVAILTDFGAGGFYAGVMKGVILGTAPDTKVVDITHSIEPHDISQASYVLARVLRYFPAGTVFVAVVDPGVGGERRNLIVETGGRFILGPDNGLFTEAVRDQKEYGVFVIDPARLPARGFITPVGRTFLGRDLYAPAAGAVASGVEPAELASEASGSITIIDIPEVVVGPGRVSGRARYVDPFGNILTGITGAHLAQAFDALESGNIRARVNQTELGPLCEFYGEKPPGTMIAVRNSWDVVEVAVAKGRAAEKFPGQSPTIELYSSKE